MYQRGMILEEYQSDLHPDSKAEKKTLDLEISFVTLQSTPSDIITTNKFIAPNPSPIVPLTGNIPLKYISI